MECIRIFIESTDSRSDEAVGWLDIRTLPINEYNIKGLLDMTFPTLFPTGDVNWLHPHTFNVEMNEYGLHLLRYCDQIFGSHPRFRYFLLNIIMRHRT